MYDSINIGSRALYAGKIVKMLLASSSNMRREDLAKSAKATAYGSTSDAPIENIKETYTEWLVRTEAGLSKYPATNQIDLQVILESHATVLLGMRVLFMDREDVLVILAAIESAAAPNLVAKLRENMVEGLASKFLAAINQTEAENG